MAAAGEKEGARGCPRSPCLWPRAGEVREVVGPRGLCVSHTPGIRTFGRRRQSPKRAGPFHSLRHSPAGWSAPGRVQALAVREPAVPATSPGLWVPHGGAWCSPLQRLMDADPFPMETLDLRGPCAAESVSTLGSPGHLWQRLGARSGQAKAGRGRRLAALSGG